MAAKKQAKQGTSKAVQMRVRLAVKALEIPEAEGRKALRSDKALRAFALGEGLSLDWLWLGNMAPTLRYVREFMLKHRGN
jgi:hypothetical protein